VDIEPNTQQTHSGRNRWIAVSQVASSLSNLALLIGVAHVGSDELVGTIGSLSASYLIALSIGRGLVGDPWLLSKDPGRDEDAVGLAVLIGVASGLTAWFTLRHLLVHDQLSLAVLGGCLPVLLAQDALRYVAFRRLQPRLAAASDVLWAVVAAGGIVWIIATGQATVFSFVVAWVAGGALAALLLGRRFRTFPSMLGGLSLVRRESGLRASLLWDSMLTNGAIQVALLLTAVVAGLGAAGQIRFLQAVFGPVTLLYGVSYVSEATLSPGMTRRPVVIAKRMAQLLAGASLVVAVGMWIVPQWLGLELAGETFLQAQILLLPFLAPQVISVVGAAAMAGLRFDGRADVAARIRTVWAVALIAGTVAGGRFGGVHGVIAGTALAHAFGTLAWWRALLRERK
jgi:hypothetical protein